MGRALPSLTSLGLVCPGTSLLKQVFFFFFLKKFTEIEFTFHRTHPFKVYNVWSSVYYDDDAAITTV